MSAVLQSPSSSNQFMSTNINHPALLYSSASDYSMNSKSRGRRSSNNQHNFSKGKIFQHYLKHTYNNMITQKLNKCRHFIKLLYPIGHVSKAQHTKDSDAGQFIQYAESGFIGEPYFDYSDYEGGKSFNRNKEKFRSHSGVVRSTIRNVTAQLGTTTYLHCRVNNLGGKTVRIFSILTYYSKNNKYYLLFILTN